MNKELSIKENLKRQVTVVYRNPYNHTAQVDFSDLFTGHVVMKNVLINENDVLTTNLYEYCGFLFTLSFFGGISADHDDFKYRDIYEFYTKTIPAIYEVIDRSVITKKDWLEVKHGEQIGMRSTRAMKNKDGCLTYDY